MDESWDGDPLETKPLAWPSAGADLRAEDDDWWFVASIDWQQGQWNGYVEGFRQTAKLIFDRVSATGHGQDALVFPFLTVWRHYAEIQLKSLTLYLQAYVGKPAEMHGTHRIDELWRVARGLLQEANHVGEADELENVQCVLLQLHDLDPTSQHFRYPVNRQGAKTLNNVNRIHIRLFHEAMEEVASFLDAAETGICDMLDTRSEYESEMDRE
ncbi:hypothetical protein [Streptosporangium sp. NPDC049046]|uniref:hypothetical protein n=1 Tax=Streptosporangium sp. NPDC049046 TaxID=3155031 RepID=UPI003430049C